jgi:hypothetical protein
MVQDEVKSPISTEELLAGVVYDNKIYDKVVIREMGGEEEDILADKKGSASEKITKVLASVITSLEASDGSILTHDDKSHGVIHKLVKGMTIGDRLYLFIRLRVLSLGNIFMMEFNSPFADEKFRAVVNLDELEAKKLEDKAQRTREFALKTGQKVVIRLATGDDEDVLGRVEDSKSRATFSLLQRIDSIDGVKPTSEQLKKMSTANRNIIRTELLKFDVGVDTSITVQDPTTKKDFQQELGIEQPDFFFPSETLAS